MSILHKLIHSPDMPVRRPVLSETLESNVRNLFIAGDLAGAPLIKLAAEQGWRVAREILRRDTRGTVVVIGAGAAGLNAALELQTAGAEVIVLDKAGVGSTVDALPEGKTIYTEPRDRPMPGRLVLRECSKEELVQLWRDQIRAAGLNVREGEAVTGIERQRHGFTVRTNRGEYAAEYVIVCAGKSGNARRLNVPGEDHPRIRHRLFQTGHYSGHDIVIVGGGNSAAEAAVALARANRVTLVHRGPDFSRVSRRNRDLLAASGARLITGAQVARFEPDVCVLADGTRLPFDHGFVLIGFENPEPLLRSFGIRLENDWTWRRWAYLAIVLALSYTIFAVKQIPGSEFWPYTGWGAKLFTFAGRPWSFWNTCLYTAVVTVFGLVAMKRWGLDRKDRFQTWRYVSLIGFQWLFFFLIPEFLFQWAVRYQWVGERLASDPNFANNAWRAYGLVYAWPLFFYTFFGSPSQVWLVWGALLSFVLIPLLVLFHGKRYCSWICGCGGLAETVGDRWRHLAPKGRRSIWWERMNGWVLAVAVVVTALVLGEQSGFRLGRAGGVSLHWYHFLVDTWLVGIIPIAAYPFFGGKIWCRYWCPLAKMMEMWSALFTRFRASRFAIASNERCIACEECSRQCQVGIDVMKYALRQEQITNLNSSCIGCGICVSVCPMNVLSFSRSGTAGDLVQISAASR